MKSNRKKTTLARQLLMLLALLPIAALSTGSAFAGSPGEEGGATKPNTALDSPASILYSQFDNSSWESAKLRGPRPARSGTSAYPGKLVRGTLVCVCAKQRLSRQ